jgi:hypothetical protein
MWLFEVGDGFDNLRMLSLDEAPGHSLFRHLSVSCRMIHPAHIQSIRLATFPGLRRLFIHPAKWEREPHWYWRLNGEVAMRPHAIEPIPKQIIGALEACPNLELIQQLSHDEHEFAAAEDDWTSIYKACDESYYSFILIGQYTFDTPRSKGPFYHLRHFSARAEVEYARQIFHARDVWAEYVDYEGTCPPADVLGQIYWAMEDRTSWLRPDRQRKMPSAALQVLDQWVNTAVAQRQDPVRAD